MLSSVASPSDPDLVAAVVTSVLAYASSCNPEDITVDKCLTNLGIDSVGVGSVGVVLESETGVAIDPVELLSNWNDASVGDLIDRLKAAWTEAHAGARFSWGKNQLT